MGLNWNSPHLPPAHSQPSPWLCAPGSRASCPTSIKVFYLLDSLVWVWPMEHTGRTPQLGGTGSGYLDSWLLPGQVADYQEHPATNQGWAALSRAANPSSPLTPLVHAVMTSLLIWCGTSTHLFFPQTLDLQVHNLFLAETLHSKRNQKESPSFKNAL